MFNTSVSAERSVPGAIANRIGSNTPNRDLGTAKPKKVTHVKIPHPPHRPKNRLAFALMAFTKFTICPHQWQDFP